MALTRIQPSALDQTLNYTANTFTANYITFGDGTTQTTAGGGGSGTDAFARTQANTALIVGQSAYTQANSEPIGTAAFVQANSANLTAVTSFNQANVSIIIGQASYGQANLATTIAQAAYGQANSASTLAQGAYDRANTKLSLEGGTIAGSLVIQNNLTVQGNVSYTGNVTSISVTGNTGQFFGYASNGFNALYAGIPTGYFLEPQIGFQVSSNYDGYAGINMQNINTGANSSSDLFITADNGTINDGFVDLGIGSSTYNYTGYSLIGKNDGYLFATGNTTTGGGNMIVGTGLNNDIVFSVGGINTSNEIGRFKYNTGLVLKQFPIKFADNTSQNTAAAPFAFSNSAFDKANTANTSAQAAFDRANSEIIGTAAYVQANTATIIGQAAFAKANTDFTNILVTSGTYGNTTYVPVITVSANGRVTNIVNTAITFSFAKNTQAFTSGIAQTYTAPANTQWVKVTVVGPGGNGGNATTSRATGGSGGGVAMKWLSMTAGQTLTYTVGTASGTASTVSSGTLTITTITANSGSNGTTTTYANSSTAGPAGGSATGGDVNIDGGRGGNSYGSAATVATNFSGKGGDCPGFGSGGGAYGSTAAAGQNGNGYGGGGGGSHGVSSTPAGAGGIIIFEAF
jgi:hypothetical protein